MSCSIDNNVYEAVDFTNACRVYITSDNEGVYVTPIDMSTHNSKVGLDTGIQGRYASPDELPTWLKEKVAVLMILPLDTPTQTIKGVGRRISEEVFWVFYP